MTTHPIIGGAKDTFLGNLPPGERGGAKGFFAATRGSGPSIGGFNDHSEKPDDSRCVARGHNFAGDGSS